MDNFAHIQEENSTDRYTLMMQEKRIIKRTSNLIGAAFLILCIAPSVVNGAIIDIVKISGQQQLFTELFSNKMVVMFIEIILSLLIFIPPFLIIPKGIGKSVSETVSFNKPNINLFLPMVLLGVGTIAFANVATNSISSFFSGFGIVFSSPNIEYPTGLFGFIISFIAVAIVPALTEEFAMRGTVLGSLKNFGDAFALSVSTLLFAMMHGNFVQVPFAIIMGFVIGFAVIKTGSIWTGILIHAINNGISVLIYYATLKVESVILNNAIYVLYFGICVLCFFAGIFLAQRRDEKIWTLNKGEMFLPMSERIVCFFSSPLVIVSLGITLIKCITSVNIA